MLFAILFVVSLILRPQSIDLNGLLRQVVELTRLRWAGRLNRQGPAVDLKLEVPGELPPLAGAPGEIRQALMNLVGNALDALPTGGQIRLRAAVQDPFVVIELAGADGAGLGLAMVYGVMQRHGGEVRLESSPGRGTTVRLLFPLAGALRAGTRPPALRILFIDDEPMVLSTMLELLKVGGHLVTGLPGGEAGVRHFRAECESGHGYDIVVTDLSMPGMDGIQVAREIKRISPRTPVILLSGWGSYANGGERKPEWVDQVIAKPPDMNVLRAALHRLTAPAG
jgi:CheY-like chemotaxis protein